jgi:phosphatidate cytidylyltransferase
MGLRRITVAVVFIPLFYFLVRYLHPAVFFALVMAGILLALYEFLSMNFGGGRGAQIPVGLAAGGLTAALIGWTGPDSRAAWITVIVIAVLLWELFFKTDLKRSLPDGAVLLLGVFYIGWLLGHLILLRKLPGGEWLVFFVFLVTWAGDTGAYYTGKAIGRIPLSPQVSPNKTVEGAVGGLILSVAAAVLAKWWFLAILSLREVLFLGFFLGLVGQLGDLVESMFKRSAGIKDSGGLIPAHGGVLDRVDSLIFTIPAFYYYLVWIKAFGGGIPI